MDFLTKIFTTDERDRLLLEIDLFKRQDFGGIRDFVLEVLKSIEDLDKFQKSLKNFDSVQITLSDYPTISLVEYIFSYLNKSTGKQILLDISVDQNILGGVIFAFKGKYQDYSVLSLLNKDERL